MKFQDIGGTTLALACGLFFAIALLFYGNVPLTSDVSYFLVADGRILDGAVPYVDILETNPPLAFWITLPAVWLARILGLSPHIVFVVYVCLAIAGALGLTRLVLQSAGETRENTAMVLLASAAALTLTTAEAFGQREHFAALLALPYLAAAAQLAEGRAPRTSLRIVAGLLCGVGMAFKPYLLAIPLLVEIFLLWEKRNWQNLFRPETLGIAAVVAVFPVFVWQFTPNYFTEIVPLTLLTYGAYQLPFSEIVWRQAVASYLLLFGIAAYFTWRRKVQRQGEWVCICASLGGFLCYLAQLKGWSYQLLPATIFVSIPVLLIFLRHTGFVARAFVLGCFGTVIFKGSINFASDQTERLAIVDAVLNGRKPERMMAFTHDLSVIFPYVESRGIEWVSRFQSFWMMPAISLDVISAERQREILAYTTKAVAEDLKKWRPNLVIVDRRSDATRLKGREIEYIRWFSRSPEFVQAWSSYKLVDSNGMFEVWELQ